MEFSKGQLQLVIHNTTTHHYTLKHNDCNYLQFQQFSDSSFQLRQTQVHWYSQLKNQKKKSHDFNRILTINARL